MHNFITSLSIIVVFKNICKDSVISTFIEVLQNLDKGENIDTFLLSYSKFISLLYENGQNLYVYLKNLIYKDCNIISKNRETNEKYIDTAKYELKLFDNLLLYDYDKIKNLAKQKYPEYIDIIDHLPIFTIESKIDFNIQDIVNSYNNNGYGQYCGFNTFKFTDNKEIVPVKCEETITFKDLKNYKYQQNVVKQNTKAFIEGKEANNILLYGDRGCGKSSSVKALVNEFKDFNLKIVQVSKDNLVYLDNLYEQIAPLPLKFIIFADDITFEENDKNYSSIKAVLEGSLLNRPKNAIIYATTNRIHFVKENFTSREGNEIHYNDTIDETVSLSDRFGIKLTFSILTKNEYIDIVKQIAKDYGIIANDNLIKKAEEFSALKGIRTPRTARQFISGYISGIEI